MKNIRFILICCLVLCSSWAIADVQLVLKDGQTVVGNIVFENEQVVVIRNADGERFQYQYSDIAEVNRDYVAAVEEEESEDEPRKVAVNVQVAAGAAFIPHGSAGGMMSVMAHVGACNVLDRHLFIGGGFGYMGVYMHPNLAYLPLVLRAEMPLIQTKNAPALGASVGYGFQPAKGKRGGLHAELDFGWRYQKSQTTAFGLGLNATVQQGMVEQTETIDGVDYLSNNSQTICTIGAKFTLQF